jgi:hypothetical protein
MKAIQLNNNTYQYVNDEIAEREVSFGRAKYCTKSLWKKNTRDVTKSEETIVAETKGEKTKSKKAIRAAKLKTKQRQPQPTDKFVN